MDLKMRKPMTFQAPNAPPADVPIKARPSMTLDSFDVIWILSLLAGAVLTGWMTAELWFALFGMFMFHWFMPSILDRWIERKVERDHQAWRRDAGLE